MFKQEDIEAFQIIVNCGGQNELRNIGVMIPANWAIPEEREKQILSLGLRPPSPVSGHILLDTGAPNMLIDEDVAQVLKLKPIGETKEIHGIGGKKSLNTYSARLILPVRPIMKGVVVNESFGFRIPVEPAGIAGFRQSHIEWNHRLPDGSPVNVIGIMGRILLQFMTLTYDGMNGRVTIRIDKSIMKRK